MAISIADRLAIHELLALHGHLSDAGDFGQLMSSTEWLVERLGEVPLHVIPCYQPYLPRFPNDQSFQQATQRDQNHCSTFKSSTVAVPFWVT